METFCGECGVRLPDDAIHDPVTERTPCPNCQSTDRQYRVEFSSSIAITGSVDVTLEPFTASAIGTAFDATVVTTSTRVADLRIDVAIDRLEDGRHVLRIATDDGEHDCIIDKTDDALLDLSLWIAERLDRSADEW